MSARRINGSLLSNLLGPEHRAGRGAPNSCGRGGETTTDTEPIDDDVRMLATGELPRENPVVAMYHDAATDPCRDENCSGWAAFGSLQ